MRHAIAATPTPITRYSKDFELGFPGTVTWEALVGKGSSWDQFPPTYRQVSASVPVVPVPPKRITVESALSKAIPAELRAAGDHGVRIAQTPFR